MRLRQRRKRHLQLLVLLSLICALLATVPFAAVAEDMRIAVFAFRDTLSIDPAYETVPGLGVQIRDKLSRYFVERMPQVPLTSNEIVAAILDQHGLDQMGIIDAEYLAELGAIESFTHIWAGSYTLRGTTIDIEAQLWSLQEAEVVEVAHASLSRFIPEWFNAVELLVCSLFRDIHFRMTSESLSIPCPRVFPGVGFDVGAQIGLASVRMGAVNNVIREAQQLSGVNMDEFRWMPEATFRTTYAFMPYLEIVATAKYAWGSQDAGASANVTLDVNALSVLGGLGYVWEPQRDGSLRIEFDGQIGWSRGNLRKLDVEGVLACPARVVADGFSFDASARISVEILDGWSAELVVGLRGMRLPSPSAQVRDLDFGGITLALTLNGRLWGN